MQTSLRKKMYIITVIVVLLFAAVSIPGVRQCIVQASRLIAHADVEGLRTFILSFGIWGPVVSIGLMILQAVIPPLPAIVIVITTAWVYGPVQGFLYSWIGTQLGALIAFWIARGVGRPVVERVVGQHSLGRIDIFFERYGQWAVFLARLTPILSFDLVSYAAGLTNMGLRTYCLATALGQIPGTLVYTLLGREMNLSVHFALRVLGGIALLIAIGWVAKQCFERVRAKTGE